MGDQHKVSYNIIYFDRFDHDNLIAKHHYFRWSRPPDVDEIKIFDKHDHAGRKTWFLLSFLQNGRPIVIS